MTTLINTTEPFLRILNPATGEYAAFSGGRLDIDTDDPNYEVVMREAVRRPTISIHESATTCPNCGEVFTGKAAKANLGQHRKAVHFELWQADKEAEHAEVMQREVKARAGFACDVCNPVQTFGDEAGLAEHVKLLHTAAPSLDEDGNEVTGKGKRRPGEVAAAEIPAATPSNG